MRKPTKKELKKSRALQQRIRLKTHKMVLALSCPYCLAKIGEVCRTVKQRTIILWRAESPFHMARYAPIRNEIVRLHGGPF